MKKLYLVLAFLAISGVTQAQDLRPDVIALASTKIVLNTAPGSNFEEHNVLREGFNFVDDFILQMGHAEFRGYLIAKDLFANYGLPLREKYDAGKNLGVNNFSNLALGFSYGNDSLRAYAGMGCIVNSHLRANLGFYCKIKRISISALTDFGSADWRYDIRVFLHNNRTKDKFAIGVYAKSMMGFGFIGEFEPVDGIILNGGFGHDPEFREKIKMRLFLGLGFAIQ